jgi:archaeal flagellar protein FlaI
VEYELNILIAGGSGSGKTTLLNAVCNLIPPSVHVLSIESLREIHIPETRAWNWLSLTTREEANSDPINMTDLMSISLKMRPERIVLGEAVRPEDIKSLFRAMQVGHPVYSTMHAMTSKDLILRVMDPLYGIPKTDINALDLVVVMYNDIKEKSRKVIEVSEIVFEDTKSDDSVISLLYQYSPKSKGYMKLSKERKIFDKVTMKTGMKDSEMLEDIAEKKLVLQWAMDNRITMLKNFEQVVQEYYTDRKNLLARMKAKR